MEDWSAGLANILDKVETLMVKYARAKEENKNLRTELEDMRRLKEERDQRVRELDEKITVLKTVREIGQDDEDRAAIRQKVSEYIKEIDRCIALLNT